MAERKIYIQINETANEIAAWSKLTYEKFVYYLLNKT